MQNIVLETEELRRVRDLPRRDWTKDNVEETVRLLSEYLKTERGTQTLLPSQAVGLREGADYKGLFAPIQVGGGKTLLSLLLSQVTEAKRALLLIPAGLMEKTVNETQEYSKNWKIRPLAIESYETLSRDKLGRILDGLNPDLIIADEADKLKNTSIGCTKRLSNYIRKVRKAGIKAGLPWPYGVTFAAMTGTPTTRSIREYWHLIRWALGPNTPLPHDVDEFMGWSLALDERISADSRWNPGALVRLSPNPEGDDELRRARNAYATRLIESRGVITTPGERPAMGLQIRGVPIEATPEVSAMIAEMRSTWCTPDGHPFEQPTQLWRHARELQCGFYYVWDPRPPDEWMAPRLAWHSFVREKLAYSRTLATPGDVIDKVKEGKIDDGGRLAAWQAVRNTFRPNPVPIWVDDTALQYAADWLNTGDSNSKLCWVEHRAVGPALEALTGVPYFGQGGLNNKGTLVDNHKGPAIVSVKTCGTGRNLQGHKHQNLYMSPMSKSNAWQQSLGRTHRKGQAADIVTVEILFMCRESYSSMVFAIREAEYAQQTTLELQKLCYADRDLGSIEALVGRRDDEMWKQEIQGV